MNPKYKQMQKLTAILEMIAKVYSRLAWRRSFCEEMYGRGASGNIKCTESDLVYITEKKEVLKRLKGYYNTCLGKVEKYTFASAIEIKEIHQPESELIGEVSNIKTI